MSTLTRPDRPTDREAAAKPPLALGDRVFRGLAVGSGAITDADIDGPAGRRPPDSVEAYVLDGKGYSVQRVGKIENVAFWGSIPRWWLLLGLVLATSGFWAMRRAGWTLRPSAEAGIAVKVRERTGH